jgi:hypothetical protein
MPLSQRSLPGIGSGRRGRRLGGIGGRQVVGVGLGIALAAGEQGGGQQAGGGRREKAFDHHRDVLRCDENEGQRSPV